MLRRMMKSKVHRATVTDADLHYVGSITLDTELMALAVRERTKEMGVMKTLGFSSPRILRLVLGESLLLAFLGAGLGVGIAALMLSAMASQGGNAGPPIWFAPQALLPCFLIALALGLVTGALPAMEAYRMRSVDALGRK